MRQAVQMTLGIVGLLVVNGCRTATRVSEVPRVDLELEGGNRGYLVGTAPASAELKTTRQMVETTMEIPSFYKPKRTGGVAGPFSIEGIAPPEMETEEAEPSARTGGIPEKYDTYVVQKGDSLWSIAAKPEIYGKATKWRRIFDANKELLKGSPDRLRAGMTLNIPRGGSGGPGTAYDDEGMTYKK